MQTDGDSLKTLTATEGELSRLVQWFESAEDSTRDARETSEKCRDYYDGEQYTPEEIATLKKRKQPVIVVNRIKPKINTLKGMESKSRTNPKALPRNVGFDEEAAEACQDSIRYVLDTNDADNLFSSCFDDLCVEGTEAMEVNVRPVPGSQDFDITLRQIHWDRQFIDPHAREKSGSDAKYHGEVVWLDLEDAEAAYPDAKAVISATLDKFGGKNGDTYNDKPQYRWADSRRQRVCLISICYLKAGQWMHAIFVRGGFVQEPQPMPFKDEDGNSESCYFYQSAYVDRDGNRYGPVKDWLSLQDEINKRRSKALHLLNVRQVKTRKGAVDSIANLRAELAKPDGVVEENIENGVQLLPTGDMAQAQFQLLAEAKAEIDAVGVNAAMAGTETRSMSGRALEARANAGSSEVQPILDAHAHFKNRIYRAIWNRIRQYWTAEKWVRVTDNEKNIKFVGLNQPVTMLDKVIEQAKKNGQQIDPQMVEQLKQDPRMSQVVGTKNVPAQMDVDVILDEVPDFAALQSEQFAQLSDLAGKGMPIPPEAIIKASSLRDKDAILKMMRGENEGEQSPQVVQLQQQMQAMDKAIQEMTKENESLKADQSLKAAEVQVKAQDVEIKAFEAQTRRMEVMTNQAVVNQPTPEPAPDLTPAIQELGSFLSQGMEQKSQEQQSTLAQMFQQLAQVISESAQATQQSIQMLAEAMAEDRARAQAPRRIKLSSGKVIEVNQGDDGMTVTPIQ